MARGFSRTTLTARGEEELALQDRQTDDPATEEPIFAAKTADALAVAGLSHAEARTLEVMFRAWLGGANSRAALAQTLGVAEGTLRTRMSSIRTKMGIERSRGALPILAWLVDRELLDARATAKALAKLVRT